MVEQVISKADCKALLPLFETRIADFEYLTPSMFAGVLDILIHSYLRGKGHKVDFEGKGRRRQELVQYCLDNLVDFSLTSPDCVWFLERLEKVQEINEEQNVLDE